MPSYLQKPPQPCVALLQSKDALRVDLPVPKKQPVYQLSEGVESLG